MGEVDSGCLAGFRHVGGASRPPKVPLTGSFAARSREERGWWSMVSGRAQGTAVVPPWLTGDAQMVVVAGRVCVREEKRRCRGERERVAS